MPNPWRNRLVELGGENPRKLAARVHASAVEPAADSNALLATLDRNGWIAPITVSRRTGLVLDGRARLALAIARHEKSVPVLYVELSADEEAGAAEALRIRTQAIASVLPTSSDAPMPDAAPVRRRLKGRPRSAKGGFVTL